MKRFLLVLVVLLCLSVALMFLSGCSKKEEPVPEVQTEQMEEAVPVDTTVTVPDTTEMELPE
jgi:PBP1b-binding outer membrane lipoprotein LpoB